MFEGGRPNDEAKTIDLEPHQWSTRIDDVEQPKPPEPFWGGGWPFGLQCLIATLVGGVILHLYRGH